MKRTLLLSIICITFSSYIFAQQPENNVNKVINTLKERINLAGYIQAGYTYDDDKTQDIDHNFDIKRIIFMAEGKITDKWSCYFMYNFNAGGTLLEAYTDYKIIPGLSARLGQFKVPYTIESPLSPTTVELIECYSQAINYLAAIGNHDPLIGGTGGRDLGFMVFGDLFDNILTYHAGVINGQGINTRDRNNNKDIIGSVMVKPLNWLSLGTSCILGQGHAITSSQEMNIMEGQNYKRNRWAAGAVIETKPISLRTEYLGGKDAKTNSEGYYLMASYHAFRNFDIIASYDYFNKNKSINDEQTNYIAGVQYWFYPRCRLQAQYTYKDNRILGASNMIQAQVQVRF